MPCDPGVTTGELDAIAARELKARGATSNFKGYRPAAGIPPFPGVICASVNDEIVHGIPGKRVLVEGDIIAIDFGAIVDGWHGDSAITVPVGTVDDYHSTSPGGHRGGTAAGYRRGPPE